MNSFRHFSAPARIFHLTSITLMTAMTLFITAARLHAGEASDATTTLVFERLNQSYQDFRPRLAEIEQGPLRVRLSSPKQVIRLRGHRLSLRPAGKRIHHFHLTAEFEGSGELLADVDLMGLGGQFSDDFSIPPQKKEVAGKARLERSEAGLHITPVSLPKQTQVHIRTGLADRLVGWCTQFSSLTDSLLECGRLNRSLTQLSIPLPQNQSYFVADSDLSPEERMLLTQYFSGSSRDFEEEID